MPWTVLPYNVLGGVNDANVDMAGTVDADFSRRNNHFIFSEQYNLIGAWAAGANMTRVRFNVPTWNAVGRHQIYPPRRSAVVDADTGWADFRQWPLPIPQNEEIALEESNNLGAATEQENALLWIASPDWNQQVPKGGTPIRIRATAAPVGVAQAWSAPVALTFADNLKGGFYTVFGMQVQATACLFFRIIPLRYTPYQGRKMRPGGLCHQALGDIPPRWQDGLQWDGMGTWFQFHSFEPPLFEVWANSAGAVTAEIRLDCLYTAGRGGQF